MRRWRILTIVGLLGLVAVGGGYEWWWWKHLPWQLHVQATYRIKHFSYPLLTDRCSVAEGVVMPDLMLNALSHSAIKTPAELPRAEAICRELAESGDAVSQLNLATMLFDEDPSNVDLIQQSVDWKVRASTQGYPLALSALGSAYWEGHGVTKDRKKAVEYLTPAAQSGDVISQVMLLLYYSKNDQGQQDLVQALAWNLILLSSAELPPAGHQVQLKRHDELVAAMTPDQVAEAERVAHRNGL